MSTDDDMATASQPKPHSVGAEVRQSNPSSGVAANSRRLVALIFTVSSAWALTIGWTIIAFVSLIFAITSWGIWVHSEYERSLKRLKTPPGWLSLLERVRAYMSDEEFEERATA